MIIEQYMESKICLQEWMDSPGSVSVSDDNPSRSFDCNICLDSVQDPVVTFCGHLFCWPCIYKWLSTRNQGQKQHICPVCKAEVSDTTLIPLYGRGSVTSKESRPKASQFGMVIPKRPPGPTCGVSTIQGSPDTTDNHGYSYQPQAYFPQQDSYPDSPMFSPRGTPINVPDPVIRMFGEMVYTRVFGNSVTNFYTYPNSYNLARSTSPRIRRHVMQADKSLGRISFFLFCCIFLCLLLF
ncbi:E3 ubiquitin-protein ligase RMA1H1 [Gossypium arboreum]|uniref:E3 ubiquitin-protein ligase RMA n=6 Tax=Gossypium TaxID=3633 RepID=A0ABM3BK67_GOSHI|nr:E3 ubiquitin-protein ligase RMA1H1-like [Gossypium arboreum]XP_040967453.1 E3 ubiquitin-protein ligase RMA1H1-like [Gossypium hirsutum]XP_040967454.1 E3 ubiquitin-protein ligase RMA1H1-like [Gossypium hirsutum]KAB2087752.1 hypothetical protein ES319_A04G125700v1 [Gossypium barbadense]TYH22576.1 hypothetical protein ES288_A04G139900v1 [Gossypium darwinii]TYJ40338.1 hypothetical protein E1A91_A04G133600v1 [Gossypium mustelinum]KAG4205431.1 hypothetical protein ERO13_A04G104100v2 [Gossypium h